MNFNKDMIDFLRNIKHKLDNEEKEKLQEIIDFSERGRKNNINTINKKRKENLIEKEINKINSRICYYNRKGNTDRVAELVMEREELYRKRDRE